MKPNKTKEMGHFRGSKNCNSTYLLSRVSGVRIPAGAPNKTGPPHGGPVLFHSARDSNHVRTRRGRVHEPVRTLVNTDIGFPVPREGNSMQANPRWSTKTLENTTFSRVFSLP